MKLRTKIIGITLTLLLGIAIFAYAQIIQPGCLNFIGSDGRPKCDLDNLKWTESTDTLTVANVVATTLTQGGKAGRGAFTICGDATTVNNNTVYYGPPATTLTANTADGIPCDITGVGNVTEATADAPILASAFKVTGMICRSNDSGADLSYTLRTAAGATVPSVTCSIADNSTNCAASVETTTDVAAGATVAIAVASTSDVGAAPFACRVSIAY